jgi:hypothetical protein
MFDDLEDLLDDAPKVKPTTNARTTSSSNVNKAKSTKQDDEFDWDSKPSYKPSA